MAKVYFLQFSYSLGEREVEKEVLRPAQEPSAAVLINGPTAAAICSRACDKPLPEWAG